VSGTGWTRRDEQRERTRRELVDAAARVFARVGYHAASVDQVAEAAGFTKGAVYSNFSSKESLFLAVLDRQDDQAIEVLEQVLVEAEPAELPSLLAERRGAIELLGRDWAMLELEFVLCAARHEQVAERVAARQRRIHERIAALVRRYLDQIRPGGSNATEADELATLFLATTSGLALRGLTNASTSAEADRLLARLASTLLPTAATAAPSDTVPDEPAPA
jgi:AcrR family transcriptional regulator